jgi:type IV pilus assembly protein PilC
MATTFAYKVRDKQGKVVEGSLEAESRTVVVGKLREMGFAPVSVEEQTQSLGKTEIKMPWAGKIKQKDIAVMSRQFSTMINSGLSLLRALNILAEQVGSVALREILNEVRNDVERGSSLSQALAKHPKAFGPLYVSMVKSGETAGALDSTLVRMAETLEKDLALRQKIKSAMTYPVAVFGMVILIVSAMLMFVVPMFEELYSDLGGTLPLPTRILIGASNLISTFWYLWFGALFGAIWGFKRWIQTDNGRAMWDAIKLRLPVFGVLVHKTALSRFSRTLASLLRSGVPILGGLEIVKDTVNNRVVAKAVSEVQASVKEGASISKPLEKHAVFPPMVVQMMAVGEETGALDEMLGKIADFYDQEIDATVEALTSLIEPLLIGVMGAAVGGMVVALYMPMFNIINLVQ